MKPTRPMSSDERRSVRLPSPAPVQPFVRLTDRPPVFRASGLPARLPALLLVLFLMLASVLSACSSTGLPGVQADLSGDAGAESGSVVTISLIHYFAEQPKIQALQNLVAGFSAENPRVRVDVQSMSLDQYAGGVRMKLASGSSPNIIQGNPKSYRDFVDSGNILDLTDQDFVGRIEPQFLSNVTVNDRVMGIPLDLMPSGVFYSRTLFAQAGVSVPTTWSAFVEVCRTLEKQGIVPIAAGYRDQASIGGACYTEVYGTPLSKMPDFREQVMSGERTLAAFPEMRAFLERFRERNRHVNADARQIGIDSAEQMFATGKAAMIVLGGWGLSAVRSYGPDGDFGVFLFPSSEDGSDLMSTATDDTFMLTSHAGNRDAGLRFFDYMTTKGAATKWADDVQAISAVTGVRATAPDPMLQDMQTIYDSGRVQNWLAAQDFYGQYNDLWMSRLQEFSFNPETDIDAFLESWDREIEMIRAIGK